MNYASRPPAATMLDDAADTGGNGATLATLPPALTTDEAVALARRVFGIEATAKLLTSERDQNFRLSSDDGRTWLLKISNPSEHDAIVDLQTAALDHIRRAAPDCPVPRVQRTVGGDDGTHLTLADGRRSRVRLLTYLEGMQVRDTVRTASQRASMGAALAGLDRALSGFSHPAASHDLLWNVARADRLAGMIDDVASGTDAAVLRLFMERFCTDVQPRLAALRAQMVHNDYHLFNVLVAAKDESRVTGIIDFGDMVHAPLVAEVATGAAYQLRGCDDPLSAAAEFVAAYHRVLPLEVAEQAVVADLMATRHLITAIISGWRSKCYPENMAYIMRHNSESWDALRLMADLPRAALRDRLLAGIGNGDDQ